MKKDTFNFCGTDSKFIVDFIESEKRIGKLCSSALTLLRSEYNVQRTACVKRMTK